MANEVVRINGISVIPSSILQNDLGKNCSRKTYIDHSSFLWEWGISTSWKTTNLNTAVELLEEELPITFQLMSLRSSMQTWIDLLGECGWYWTNIWMWTETIWNCTAACMNWHSLDIVEAIYRTEEPNFYNCNLRRGKMIVDSFKDGLNDGFQRRMNNRLGISISTTVGLCSPPCFRCCYVTRHA